MNSKRIPSPGMAVVATALLAATGWARAQQDFDQVQIETLPVSRGIHMLVGEGGNIGVSAGEDGISLVDDQYAPLTEKIKKALEAISPGPVRFVLNTHWHWDHTGGNENLGEAGVLLVAHDRVRLRMSSEQFVQAFNRRVPPSPAAALPVVTFSDRVTFHLNQDEIHAFHVPPAHTDGDAVVHFRRANVVHMGDLFTNRRYPFIDVSSGGSVDGMVAASRRVLELINDESRVIPGHGPLGDYGALKRFHRMLSSVRDRVREAMDQGKSLEEIVAMKPTRDFDGEWGSGSRKGDDFVKLVHQSLRYQRP